MSTKIPTYLPFHLPTNLPQGQGASRPSEAAEEEQRGVPDRPQRWWSFQSGVQVIIVSIVVMVQLLSSRSSLYHDHILLSGCKSKRRQKMGWKTEFAARFFYDDEHDGLENEGYYLQRWWLKVKSFKEGVWISPNQGDSDWACGLLQDPLCGIPLWPCHQVKMLWLS